MDALPLLTKLLLVSPASHGRGRGRRCKGARGQATGRKEEAEEAARHHLFQARRQSSGQEEKKAAAERTAAAAAEMTRCNHGSLAQPWGMEAVLDGHRHGGIALPLDSRTRTLNALLAVGGGRPRGGQGGGRRRGARKGGRAQLGPGLASTRATVMRTRLLLPRASSHVAVSHALCPSGPSGSSLIPTPECKPR